MANPNIRKLKWKIGIFGTDWDQKYLRELLRCKIDENMEFVSFFKPHEFGIESNIHPHQTCVNAVPLCDIALFFINKRYGGPYKGETFWKEAPSDWLFRISVTHAEYRKAKMEKIPTIVFVHSQAYKELGDFFIKPKKDNESDIERYESIKKDWNENEHYVRNPEVYCFLREACRGIGEKQSYQSWISEYNDDDLGNSCQNLKKKLLENITGLTPHFLRKLANRQYEAIQNEQNIGTRVNYRLLKKNDFLIEREAQDETMQHITNLKDTIRETSSHAIITGDSNIGKTFFMIELFGDDVKACDEVSGGKKIPIFLSFKNRPKTLSLENIVSDELVSFYFPGYPFNLGNASITLYIDGVDEGEFMNTTELRDSLKNLLASTRNLRLILSMRQQYYEWNHTTFKEIFKDTVSVYRILRIKENEGEELIYKVLKTLGTPLDREKIDLKQVISDDLFQEPMHCVMTACILHDKSKNKELNVQNVYDSYIRLLAEHEASHMTGVLDIEDLYNAWRYVAYILSWKKTKGVSISCDDLRKELEHYGFDASYWERTQGTLVECNRSYARFKCESYMNSLLSAMIVDHLLGIKEDERLLATDCYYDTSLFIRSKFDRMEINELDRCIDRLFHTAFQHVFKQDENDVRIAANCIYLLGRKSHIDIRRDKVRRLIRAMKELTRKYDFVYVAALFALTELGDIEAENELNKVLMIEDIRKRNTDFHLIYYRVLPPQRSFPANIPVSDGGIDCTRLLNGATRRLKDKSDILKLRIKVAIVCDALEIYHSHYNKDDAIEWIEKVEKIISTIDQTNPITKKLIEDSQKRLHITRSKIEGRST